MAIRAIDRVIKTQLQNFVRANMALYRPLQSTNKNIEQKLASTSPTMFS